MPDTCPPTTQTSPSNTPSSPIPSKNLKSSHPKPHHPKSTKSKQSRPTSLNQTSTPSTTPSSTLTSSSSTPSSTSPSSSNSPSHTPSSTTSSTPSSPSFTPSCRSNPTNPLPHSTTPPPSTTPNYHSPTSSPFLSPSPSFNIPCSQSSPPPNSTTEFPHLTRRVIQPSPPTQIPQTSYSKALTTPPSSLNSSSVRSHPKVMFSCTPLKRSAPSPTSSPDSPTTIPPTPKRPRGDASQKNRYPCTPNTHLSNPKNNWKLPPTEKPILIIGDSNLSRITSTPSKDVQVESYPGAKLCHADRIVSSYSHPQHPEKIILSFGLNNRSTEPRSTSFHNLRKLIGTTKKTFPKSEIYFPLVNIARNLPQREIENLKKLNHLAKNDLHRVTIIPCLDSSQFELSSDPIHWTKQTANSIMKHWLHHLN